MNQYSNTSGSDSKGGNDSLKLIIIAAFCLAAITLTVYFLFLRNPDQPKNKSIETSRADSIAIAEQESRKRELDLKQKELDLKEKELERKEISSQEAVTNTIPQTYSGARGMYMFASSTSLSSNDLRGYSKWDLKIMRNEIFARHGYIFKTPEMKSYFAGQSWYVPLYDNVDHLLTRTEKQNIQLIKSFE